MEKRIYVEHKRFSKKHYINFDHTLRSKNIKRSVNDHSLLITNNSTVLQINTLKKIKEYIQQYPTNSTLSSAFDFIYNEEVLETSDYSYDLPINVRNTKRIYISPEETDSNTDLEEPSFTLQQEIEYKVSDTKSYLTYIKKTGKSLKDIFKETTRYSFEVKIPVDDEEILKCIKFLHYAIESNVHPLDKDQQDIIKENYFKATKHLFLENQMKDVSPIDPVLITPKPATLERVNLLEPSPHRNDVSILENYAVSEKADGERFLLFIDDKGVGYLIDSNKRVRGTGMECPTLSNSLFDGELILCMDRKDKSPKDLFMIFDVYQINGKKTLDFPLLSEKGDSRMEKMLNAISHIQDTTTHNFKVKEHKIPKNNETIFNISKEIIDGNYPYSIDGLIFTPSKLPVFAQYAGRPAKVRKNVRWDKVFKWKPPEQNTIDFLVESTGKEYSNDGVRVREFKLRVGYNKENMELITVKEGVSRINNYRNDQKSIIDDQSDNYRFEDYVIDGITQMTHIMIHPDNNCYTEETGEMIQNKMVVEFRYNKNDPLIASVKRWIPNRIRYDKNDSIAEGKISKTANDIEVAMNIWRSIKAPITIDNITGVSVLEQNDLLDAVIMTELGADDKYYNREKKNLLISSPMIFIHNHIIKKFLYEETRGEKGKTLLELGCGQGSDMSRWEQAGFRKIIGIDYIRDNIENPVNGVYRRLTDMYKMRHKKNGVIRSIPHMFFLIGDCKLPFHNGKSARVIENNQESIDFMKVILGGHRIHDRYNKLNILTQFSDLHKDGFDVVSCQFTIHYFFDTEQSLDGFLNNVVKHLKEGGKFVATYMDGDHVENMFNKNGTVVGIDDKSGAVVWQIVRRYNTIQRSKYGKAIDVYIENTGKLITENLVNTNLLIEKAEEKGLKVYKRQMFKETVNKIDIDELNTTAKIKIEEFNNNDTLKQFSFLNMWIIFEKK